jgi:polysaccharide export outer membrane protein
MIPFKHCLSALLTAGTVLFFAACSSVKNVSYLQDIQPGVPIQVQETRQLALQPGDRLRITVFSRDRELTELFNLAEHNAGNTSNGERHPYTVRTDGTIEIPTLGQLRVEGQTRQEVADLIKYQLISSKLLLDPTVIVEFYEPSFFTLGEVNHTGRITIPTDQLTIVEALALAGDLTINGRRENVLVLRTVDGIQTPYLVDLTSMQSVYGSPVYYVQQNDIIYVEPNKMRADQSDLNASTFRSLGFWMSLPSYIVSLVLIYNQFKK